MGLNTDSVQAPSTELGGDTGQVEGDQGHGYIGPHWLATQAPHPTVQILQQCRVNIFRTNVDIPDLNWSINIVNCKERKDKEGKYYVDPEKNTI